MTAPALRIGLIGAGFMGRTHVLGYALANRAFADIARLELVAIAEISADRAESAAREFGIPRSSGDWRDLVDDPEIDIVDIAVPTSLHKDIALAAIRAGKHIYCEKPLTPSAQEALEVTEAAESGGLKTQVGFNYLANPMLEVAHDLIARGDLGEVYSFRGIHAEDYMSDLGGPVTFRHDPRGGGALADIGSHALATAEYLLGPIAKVMGDCETLIGHRVDLDGTRHQIRVDDISRAFLRFSSGAGGSIEANWCATGRKMQHDFEVYGSKGALVFTQERLNELRLFESTGPAGLRGFRKIKCGPEHQPYGRFCTAPGHQIGFNELKAIEIGRFAAAIVAGRVEPFGFRQGYRIQRLVETIRDSSRKGHWVQV